MRILGLFKGETTYGKRIRSGGAALLTEDSGHLSAVAIAEERVTGQKYDGGFRHAAAHLLEAEGLGIEDLDVIAASTCCEPKSNATVNIAELWRLDSNQPLPPIVGVGHHESHATLAFLGSGYPEALVIVCDGGGDVLDGYSGPEWWMHTREQLTYYSASRELGLNLIDSDFAKPLEVGFGEFYRAVSYFLGWPGSRHASKVMALSAYGERPKWPDSFSLNDGALVSALRNDPNHAISMIVELGSQLGVDLGEPREAGAEILEVHRSLAAYTQNQLETWLCSKLRHLLKKTGHKAVCFAGGVALNVVANGVLQRELGVPVYVPSAPGDDGQPLGNAMAVHWAEIGKNVAFSMKQSHNAYLGPKRKIDSSAVSSGLQKAGHGEYAVFEYSSSASVVARVLSAGGTVCVFQERSEYGPRALGSRSILGDPRASGGRALFNQLKAREWFMPFAPAGLLDEEVGNTWFSRQVDSPFMSFAVTVAAEERDKIQAVMSNDGTSRIQSLSSDDPSFVAAVIREFERLTGIPMVLNTSFNAGGRPIVETVDDALRTFIEFPINILALGRFLVVKSLSPELIEAQIMPKQFTLDGYIVLNGYRKDLYLSRLTSRECIRTVQSSTEQVVFVRSELPLYGPYLEWLREGRKFTTIRYRKGAVELPSFSELPLYQTEDYGAGDRTVPTATVQIQSIRYQIFGELTNDDAMRDGFESLEHMRRDLHKIYPKLLDDEWVTIYEIVLKE